MHGGTYNAQPVAMAATVATLQQLTPALYAQIAGQGEALMAGLKDIFASAGIKAIVTGFPQIFHVAFGLDEPARDYRDLARSDKRAYVAFTSALLRRGVRALERGAWFLSSEHDAGVIRETLAAAADAARELKAQGVV